MLEKLYNVITGKGLEMRERLFRLIIISGIIMAVGGMLETIFFMDMTEIIVPVGVLFGGMIIVAVATFKYHKVEFSAVFIAVVLIAFVFPSMFFFCGGIDGGATAWCALALFYCFLMFTGWKLCVFLIFSILVNSATYLVAYLHPDYIHQIPTRAAVYTDSIFGVLMVGIASGIFAKFYMKVYEEERAVTLAQKDELERVSKSKNDFFASMSHEIRTPINTILGLNEMILRENTEEQTREYAYHIKGAGKMLLSLVNDILDLSKIELQKMEIVPVVYETKEMIQSLVNMIKVPIMDKQLELILDIDDNLPTKLMGDEKRLQQIILNLLTNAVKYTQEGSVTLSMSGEMWGTEMITLKIMVSDTGIGIKKEDVEFLYDSFRRMDSKKNSKVEGSGLGLSITKQLVEMMGGSISVDSIYKKGSTFTVNITQEVLDAKAMGRLEYYSEEQISQEDYYEKRFEAPEARVLIVDDNEMNALVAQKLLGDTKMQIDIAYSGTECLENTKKKYYNIILLDYMMPEISGTETLRRIRMQENGLCRESAIIAMTANAIDDVENLYENNGFDDYLEKPIQADLLEKVIQKYIPKELIEYSQAKETEKESESGHNVEVLNHRGRKRKKIYVTTDCVSDLPKDIQKKLDIRLMYLYIKTKHGRFADLREINSDNLSNQLLKQDGVYADSVSVEEYEEFFAEVLTEADEVVHISLAEGAGKSFGVAVEAAKCFDHVHVIDAGQISCGEGLIAMYAAQLAVEGNSVEDIVEKVNAMKNRVHTRFLLPTAEIFSHNNYTTTAIAKFSKMFRLRPLVTCYQSKMFIVGFYSGELERAWKAFIRKQLRNRKKINPSICFVTFAGCSAKQQEFLRSEIMKRVPFERIIMQKASVSTACNAGMYTIGFSYYKNEM